MQPGWKILLVEDDPDGQEVVSTILDHLRLNHDVVSNASEAEHYLFDQGRQYSAVIIDLALPDKDGWQILSEMLNNPATAHLPSIAITAYHSLGLREEAIRAGFSAYFAKPIDATSLARRLEEMLA